MAFQRVTSLSELWEGEMKGVTLSGKKILLVHHHERVFAYQDRCAHKAALMSEGLIRGEVLVCGAHGWEYDLCTGRGVNPTSARLNSVPVRVENGEIWVDPDV
jgi:toluene monooxygenase system ferredoxin subunit